MGVAGAKIERILVRGTNWIGDAVMSTPEEAGAMLKSEFERWGPVIRSLNLDPQ